MKKLALILTVGLIFTGVAFAQTFTLKSKDLGGQFTMKSFSNSFGCTGENKSPQLYWENAPKETKTFAVTMYDKDAPTGSGWWHWVVFNIPGDVMELREGAGDTKEKIMHKKAIQSVTDYGHFGYGGPCPPPGSPHQYVITVYALDSELDLDRDASPAMVNFYLNAKSIARASIVAYGKL